MEVLAQLGAARTYGICGVELRQAPAVTAHGALSFGRLAVPGRILLYEQPISPWSLAGALPAGMRRRLERAGAVIQRMAGGARTQVSWPGGTLRDFMRYDVLFHEVAHHILQQYTGKRTVRIRRTTDHERFADHFAARCRQDFESRAPLG